MSRRLLPALLILAASPLAAQRPAPAARPDRGAALAHVDSVARRAVGPMLAGMVIGIARGNDTLLLRGYGQADLEWSIPMPVDAEFQVGSVTKQFTAAAVLRLVEQGKLSLDDDIRTHLPTVDTHGQRITIARLLDHTSGIRDYTEVERMAPLMRVNAPRDTLLTLINAEPSFFAPGTGMIYNNSAYFILGLLLEKVSGVSYADVVKRELFDRAGMTRARYCDERAVTPRRAHGYDVGEAGLMQADFLVHTWPYAAGSLCMTGGDLLAWVRGLHGGRLLSPALYRAMITPRPLVDGVTPRYALGLALSSTAGHAYIGHGGDIPGFASETRYYADDSLSVVVLMNSEGPVRPQAIADSIAIALLGARPAPASVTLPKGGATWLSGRYTGIGRGGEEQLFVEVQGDSVKVRPAPTAPWTTLAHRGGWQFDNARGHRFAFTRGTDGTPALVVDRTYAMARLRRAGDATAAPGADAARRTPDEDASTRER